MQPFSASTTLALALALAVHLASFAMVPWGLPSRAEAQANAQELAEANREAMDAYNNLDIEVAKKGLEKAAAAAEKQGVKGPALSRTYANLGVVYVGGFSDNASGLDAFVTALTLDPKVEPDPLVSTPEIQQVYLLAKRKVQGEGAATGSPTAAPTQAGAPAPVGGDLQHEPATEQLLQTGVPVYAEAGDLSVESMEISYRSLGMPRPKSALMVRMGEGFGYLIPCTDVFEPTVEYFIVAKDADGNPIGNAGTAQRPVSVAIVTERSKPPVSLPGQAPPSQCGGGNECPPGMPGCSGQSGLGATCRQDSDCSSDLVCDENFCASGQRGGRSKGRDSRAPRFFFEFGAGIGLAYVGRSAQVDTPVPQALIKDASTEEEAKAIARKAGWECPARTVKNQDGEPVPQLYDCKVAVDQAGFVAGFALRAVAGYYVLPKVYVAGMGRLQLESGRGTLAGILVGARAGYMFTQPVQEGFVASAFVGGSVGQIQVRPPPQRGGKDGPWAVSGLGGVQVGTSLGYRFMRNAGVTLTPEVHFLLPTFLLAVDLTGALQVSF